MILAPLATDDTFNLGNRLSCIFRGASNSLIKIEAGCYKEEQLTSVYFHYLEKAEEMCVCVNHVTVSESETSLP